LISQEVSSSLRFHIQRRDATQSYFFRPASPNPPGGMAKYIFSEQGCVIL
jgi:hypothetical protein